MLKRLASAVPAAMIATLAIVFSMQALVAHGKPALGPERTPGILRLPPPMEDSELRTNEPFTPPVFVDVVPVPDYRPETDSDAAEVNIRVDTFDPTITDSQLFGPATADSPLVATMRAQPVYPNDLAGRGIEGYVEVVFDVLASGVVANVQVVESSHRGFNRSAIRAAKNSRFQPAVIDGIPQTSTGVRYRFVFRLDN